MVVSIDCREQHYQENNQPYFIMFRNKFGCLIQTRDQFSVSRLLDRTVKSKNQCRKKSNTAEHTDYNTLCHNNTHITAKCECHKAQCNKSGNSCDRTSDYGFKCGIDRMGHGTFFVTFETFLVFLITVQKENRIVHGNTKLKNGCQCLCDVGNLTEKNITSQVI